MQFAWCEARVLELKDGRSRLGESESWGPSVGVQLVGGSHGLSRVCDVLTENRRLRKGWHRAVTGSPALDCRVEIASSSSRSSWHRAAQTVQLPPPPVMGGLPLTSRSGLLFPALADSR